MRIECVPARPRREAFLPVLYLFGHGHAISLYLLPCSSNEAPSPHTRGSPERMRYEVRDQR